MPDPKRENDKAVQTDPVARQERFLTRHPEVKFSIDGPLYVATWPDKDAESGEGVIRNARLSGLMDALEAKFD
jgi:hypothetical protein